MTAPVTMPHVWPRSVVVTVGLITVTLASAVTVGADTLWLVALGRAVLRDGSIPQGVPFASADSTAWVNVPVLGELAFAGLHALGPVGLPLAQLFVVAALLLLLAAAGHVAPARGWAISVTLILCTIGSLPALGVVRSQLMSLLPFGALTVLLRSENRHPSRRIWLVVPLIVVWGNLHGAVLAGLALVACYLTLSRCRTQPFVATGVGVTSIVALWATPGGTRTGAYYLGVLGNEAARRGTQLWAPLTFSEVMDVLLLLAAIALLALFALARRPLWELVAVAGLAVATVTGSRHGIWLLVFLVAPAALGLTSLADRLPRTRLSATTWSAIGVRNMFITGVSVALVALTVGIVVARAAAFNADRGIVSAVQRLAAGNPVLATEPLAESLAAEGVRVWMSNPIDAFARQDQAAYLNFMEGEAIGWTLPASVRVAVAPAGSPAARSAEAQGFGRSQMINGFQILTR